MLANFTCQILLTGLPPIHNPLGLRIISLVLSAFIFSPSKFTPYITSTHNPKAQNLCHSSSTSYELRVFKAPVWPVASNQVAGRSVLCCSNCVLVAVAGPCCRRMEVSQHQPATSRWVEDGAGNEPSRRFKFRNHREGPLR